MHVIILKSLRQLLAITVTLAFIILSLMGLFFICQKEGFKQIPLVLLVLWFLCCFVMFYFMDKGSRL